MPANLTYTDLQTRVANALKIPTSNTTEMAKVAALVNEIYRGVYALKDWDFLRKRTVINTVAGITSLTANVTNNSTAVTFSSAPQSPTGTNVSVAGWVMIVPGAAQDADAVYRVATHTSGLTAATLDADYTDAANTAAGIRLYKDSYDLPTDTGKVLIAKRFGESLPMERIGPDRFSTIKQQDQTADRPQVYCVFDFATTGDPTTAKQFQIHPYPDKTYRMELFYKQQLNTELSGTTRSYIPDEFAHLLIYGALALGFPTYLNDTDRGAFYQTRYDNLLAIATASEPEYTKDHPAVRPADDYRRGNRRSRRRGGVTLGSFFDRLPSEW